MKIAFFKSLVRGRLWCRSEKENSAGKATQEGSDTQDGGNESSYSKMVAVRLEMNKKRW